MHAKIDMEKASLQCYRLHLKHTLHKYSKIQPAALQHLL